MARRIFIIVLGILAIIAIGFAVYFLFFRNTPTLTPSTGNPFGQTGDDTTFTPTSTLEVGEKLTNAGEEVAPRLIRITKEPVAYGAVAFISTTTIPVEAVGTTTATSTRTVTDIAVRYIERASGNVYEYLAKARELTRLSNRTLPGVVEAAWAADGSRAFVRFLTQNEDQTENLETYALPANGEGGYVLEKNLKEVAVLGTTNVFSLLSSDSGSIGTVANIDGTGSKTLFSSPLSSLRVFPSKAGYFAATDPLASVPGYAFRINSTGTLSRILGPLLGLSILPSPSGSSLLLSTNVDGAPSLSVLVLKTREEIELPVGTLAEKCVWSKDETMLYCGVPSSLSGTLPNDWYQGKVSFSDRLWKISLTDRLATLVIDPAQVGKTPIDMVALTLDPATNVLVFTNKKDLSLWAYSF